MRHKVKLADLTKRARRHPMRCHKDLHCAMMSGARIVNIHALALEVLPTFEKRYFTNDQVKRFVMD